MICTMQNWKVTSWNQCSFSNVTIINTNRWYPKDSIQDFCVNRSQEAVESINDSESTDDSEFTNDSASDN